METDSGAERRLVEMAFGSAGPDGYADAARRYVGGVLCVPDRLPSVLVGPVPADVGYLGDRPAAALERLRARAEGKAVRFEAVGADRECVAAARAAGLVPDDDTPAVFAAAEHWRHAVLTMDGALCFRLAEAGSRLDRDLAQHWERSGGRAGPPSLVAAACAPVLDLLERQAAAFDRLGELAPEFGRTARLNPSFASVTGNPRRLAPELRALAADSGMDSPDRFVGALSRLGGYRRHLPVAPGAEPRRLRGTLAAVRSALSTVSGGRPGAPETREPQLWTDRPGGKPEPPRRAARP